MSGFFYSNTSECLCDPEYHYHKNEITVTNVIEKDACQGKDIKN